MFAFHFVSLVGEVTAANRCAMYTCQKKATEKYERKKKELAYSTFFLFQPIVSAG